MWNNIMKKTILILSALVGAMLWTGCQPVEDIIPEVIPEEKVTPEGKLTLTLQASKSADTKALSLDDNTLNAYWVTGEKVDVFLEGTWIGSLEAKTDGSPKPSTATLSGTLNNTSGLTAGKTLSLLFPGRTGHDWDYTGQDGSAPSADGTLATKYDYALAIVNIQSVSGNTISTTTSAQFVNQQSIYRFGFKVGGTTLSVQEFTLSSNCNKLVTARNYSDGWTSTFSNLTVKPASATSDLLYLALRNENTTVDDTFSFYVIGNDKALYVGNKVVGSTNLDNGKFISAQNVSVAKSNLAQASGTVTEVW